MSSRDLAIGIITRLLLPQPCKIIRALPVPITLIGYVLIFIGEEKMFYP